MFNDPNQLFHLLNTISSIVSDQMPAMKSQLCQLISESCIIIFSPQLKFRFHSPSWPSIWNEPNNTDIESIQKNKLFQPVQCCPICYALAPSPWKHQSMLMCLQKQIFQTLPFLSLTCHSLLNMTKQLSTSVPISHPVSQMMHTK